MNLQLIDVELAMTLILSFARVYGFMYFFPLISGEQVPAMVRALVCMALTPYVAFPQISDTSLNLKAEVDMAYALLIKEAAVGAFMGFVVGLPLRLPEIIGGMIDNQRGTAVTDTYNPTSGRDASLLGPRQSRTLVVDVFSSGGFNQLVLMLAGSFKLLPLSSYTPLTGPGAWAILLEMFGRYLGVFAILTLPVMAAMFLAEIALAVASRFAQSLNVFTLAQPVKALVAISLLVTMMPLINREIMSWMGDIMQRFGL
jgi:type III secretion protein T